MPLKGQAICYLMVCGLPGVFTTVIISFDEVDAELIRNQAWL